MIFQDSIISLRLGRPGLSQLVIIRSPETANNFLNDHFLPRSLYQCYQKPSAHTIIQFYLISESSLNSLYEVHSLPHSRLTRASFTPLSRPSHVSFTFHSRLTHDSLSHHSSPSHAQLKSPTHASLTPDARPTHIPLTPHSHPTHRSVSQPSRAHTDFSLFGNALSVDDCNIACCNVYR